MDLDVKTSQFYHAEIAKLKKELFGEKELVKKLRDELRIQREQVESFQNYQYIVQSVPDIIYRLDTDGKITFINRAIASYGYDRKGLIGKDILEIIYPEDREKAIYHAKERRTGERRNGTIEIRLLTKERKIRQMELKTSAVYESKCFLLEAEGLYRDNMVNSVNFIGTQGIAREVSRQKSSDQQASRLALIVEQVRDSIVITDMNGFIEYVNPTFEKTTGFRATEAIGQNINFIKSGRQTDEIYRDLWNTISAGEVWKGLLINKTKQGDFIHEESVIFPVKDHDGRIINYAAVQRNVTNEKSLEQRLNQAQKMEAIGQLAGGIAHDFNNYLTVINGYTELLLSKLDKSNPFLTYINDIHKSGAQAQNLTRQLLAFSRRQMIVPKIISINETIKNIEKMLRRLIGENIELLKNLSETEHSVKADPGQIEQILVNLIINARDAIHEKKSAQGNDRISICTSLVNLDENYSLSHPGSNAGLHVCISVSDTGIGLNKDEISKVFEPFYTTKHENHGTGLGLSTVYGIVKQNDGAIYVYSEPGLGTTFKIYWPVINELVNTEPEVNLEQVQLRGQERILLVEDDESVRHFTLTALKSMGYNVVCASEGMQALWKIKNDDEGFDLIITDSVMPKMGGTKLIKNIKEIRSDVKVLIISGYTNMEIAERGELIEGINFLQKPFSVKSLGQKVRQVLDTK